MKYLCYLTILISSSIFCQTKIDKFISINIPGNVVQMDTIVANVKMQNFVSVNENETYIVQKIILDTLNNNLNNLPTDIKSLKKTYHNYMKDYLKRFTANKEYQLLDSTAIYIDKYLCYNINCKTSNFENKKVIETTFIILNEHLYAATYLNLNDFNEERKKRFLKSIKINSLLYPTQTMGNSKK